MIIWIDLDEVLAELVESLLEQNNYKIWAKKLKYEDITDYYIQNISWTNLSPVEGILLFRDTLKKDIDKLAIKPSKGVYKKLKSWKEKWYKLKVITARPGDLFKKYTLNWLDKHYPNIFDEVYFASDTLIKFDVNWKDTTKKSVICKNLWVDIMIEDNPEYANEVSSCGIKTYLLEKPWNKWKELDKNIIYVKSWNEIIL